MTTLSRRDVLKLAGWGVLAVSGLLGLGAEPILVTLETNKQDTESISHTGREFIYCLEGKVDCVIAGQSYILSPGDSLLFDAQAPHRWVNILLLHPNSWFSSARWRRVTNLPSVTWGIKLQAERDNCRS